MWIWGLALGLWMTCALVAGLISALRGYTALYGFLLGFFSVALPLGPVLAIFATERWTREPPANPVHPVRWPSRREPSGQPRKQLV